MTVPTVTHLFFLVEFLDFLCIFPQAKFIHWDRIHIPVFISKEFIELLSKVYQEPINGIVSWEFEKFSEIYKFAENQD